MLVWQGDAVIMGLTGGVLPDGLAALGHPANEDLFCGDPGSGGHFVACVSCPGWVMCLALPLVGIRVGRSAICCLIAVGL